MKRIVLFVFSAILVVFSALNVMPVSADGSIGWNGQGSENLPCANGAHWVLAPAKNITGATLTVNGESIAMTQNGQGSWSADSSGALDAGLNASVSYTGAGDSRNHLQLSHCLEGPAATPTTPVDTATPEQQTATPTNPGDSTATPEQQTATPTNPGDTPTPSLDSTLTPPVVQTTTSEPGPNCQETWANYNQVTANGNDASRWWNRIVNQGWENGCKTKFFETGVGNFLAWSALVVGIIIGLVALFGGRKSQYA